SGAAADSEAEANRAEGAGAGLGAGAGEVPAEAGSGAAADSEAEANRAEGAGAGLGAGAGEVPAEAGSGAAADSEAGVGRAEGAEEVSAAAGSGAGVVVSGVKSEAGEASSEAGVSPGAGAETVAGAGVRSDAGGGAGDGVDAVVQDSPPPRPRPWYRRRAAVFGAVACVVAATVGTLSALPDGRRHEVPGATAQAGDDVPSLSSRPGKVTPRPSGSGSPSPSVSPSVKGGGPSAEAGAGVSASPSGSGAPSKTPFAGTPLAWTVDSHVWNQGCGHYYVIDQPPAQVPPPPMSQDARAWATAEGGLHGKETMVRISVQGRSDTAVVLEALRVRVVGRGTPAAGNAYAMDQGCGGSLTPREFAVDLDKDRPIAHSMPGNDAGTELPAVSFPYRVSAKDPEILLVTARTAGCDCSWYLELDWSSQGRAGTVRVDDGGRPFRTTAITGLPRYVYDTQNRNWRPYIE
ncbi:transcriptional regulator, partial [Streptomyces acidiscabies]|uniref:transcriptional regulator n=1 Tax=Streptomyces acidiscabies TaxID=42234 RepID=UPI000AF85361